jgi:hypothetical protein
MDDSFSVHFINYVPIDKIEIDFTNLSDRDEKVGFCQQSWSLSIQIPLAW